VRGERKERERRKKGEGGVYLPKTRYPAGSLLYVRLLNVPQPPEATPEETPEAEVVEPVLGVSLGFLLEAVDALVVVLLLFLLLLVVAVSI
jgi:hypothetical protein